MDVRTQCLGLLMRGPATGYELKKRLKNGPFSHFLAASFAAIYPALSRLTAEGLVTVTASAQANRPDKKIYAVTNEGRRAFVETLCAPLAQDRYCSPWFTAMYFADLLPAKRVERLIAERLADCRKALTAVDRENASAAGDGPRFVADLSRRLLETEMAHLLEATAAFAPAHPAAQPMKLATHEAALMSELS